MYKQHLPNYKHNFLDDPRWVTYSSPHYRFHCFTDSVAEQDIDLITTTQESAYKKIVSFLKVPEPNKLIEYYFYPTIEIKTELMGDSWFAQAIYNEFYVHVLYTGKDKPIGAHEDTHLLTLPWGISVNFLQEGLAEYMVGHNWYGEPHKDCIKEGLEKGYELRPSRILTEKDWLDTPQDGAVYFYALAGEWVKYLVGTLGLEVFKKLYVESTREETADTMREKYQRYTSRSVDELEEDFLR